MRNRFWSNLTVSPVPVDNDPGYWFDAQIPNHLISVSSEESKKAFITGTTGQHGSRLAELLLERLKRTAIRG